MLSLPALLLAPLIVLGELSIAYALVSPACASQSRGLLHAVAAGSLLVVLVLTALAWRDWRGHALARRDAADARDRSAVRAVTRADSGEAAERAHFVAQIAVVVGSLSALVCASMWLPVWLLSPCY